MSSLCQRILAQQFVSPSAWLQVFRDMFQLDPLCHLWNNCTYCNGGSWSFKATDSPKILILIGKKKNVMFVTPRKLKVKDTFF